MMAKGGVFLDSKNEETGLEACEWTSHHYHAKIFEGKGL